MARRCSVCTSGSKLARVDQAILKGETLAAISRKHGFSQDSLGRHRRHMRVAATSAAAESPSYGQTVLQRAQKLASDLDALLTAAKEQRDLSLQCRLLKESFAALRFMGELTGDIQAGGRTQVNIGIGTSKPMSRDEALALAREVLALYAEPEAATPAVLDAADAAQLA